MGKYHTSIPLNCTIWKNVLLYGVSFNSRDHVYEGRFTGRQQKKHPARMHACTWIKGNITGVKSVTPVRISACQLINLSNKPLHQLSEMRFCCMARPYQTDIKPNSPLFNVHTPVLTQPCGDEECIGKWMWLAVYSLYWQTLKIANQHDITATGSS